MLKWLGDNKDYGAVYRTDFAGAITNKDSSVTVKSGDLCICTATLIVDTDSFED